MKEANDSVFVVPTQEIEGQANLQAKMKEILKQHNIRIKIGSCGCCNSPWVSFEKDGVMIVDNEEYFDIDMFKDELNV